MKPLRREGKFRKDLKRAERRGWDFYKLFAMLTLLAQGRALPPSTYPHPLHGEWKGYWECHIAGDWLLVYKITDDEVVLARTGTHADIFRE